MRINDRYEVLSVLGSGSHATVFEVRDIKGEGELLALKLLRENRPVELLRWEFERLRSIEHPNLARVFELDSVRRVQGGGDDIPLEAPFITQEMIPGRSADFAAKERREDSLSLMRWVVAVAAGICRALEHLHVRGVVHRDVKPSNFIVDDDAPLAVRLIDLSLAATGRGPGLAAGSVAYMAPEALAGAAAPRSDLFALGVSIFELISGRQPFGVDGSDVSATVRRVLAGEHPSLSDVAPVAEGLSHLVDGCLSADATERPASARDLLIELGRVMGPELVGLDGGVSGVVDLTESRPRGLSERLIVSHRGVLIGRGTELALLSTLIEERLEAQRSASPLLVVTGSAGVGKTALIEEAFQRVALRRVAGQGAQPLISSGSLRRAVEICREEWAGEERSPILATWLGEIEGRDDARGGLADGLALCEAIVETFVGAARRRPLLLRFDESEDGLIAELAVYLHRRAEVEGLVTGERVPLAVVVESRCEGGRSGWCPAKAPLVEARPLGAPEMAQIIVDRGGAALSEALLDGVVDAARGRPALALTALERLARCGPVGELDTAALDAVFEGELSLDGASSMGDTVAHLTEEERAVLFALALWGQRADAALVAQLVDLAVDVVDAALAGLWRRGLLERDEEGLSTMSSAWGSIAVTAMGASWVESFHRRAFRRLSLEPGSTPVLVALARHATAAGLGEQAAELNAAAAKALLAAGEQGRASEHFQLARSLGARHVTGGDVARALAAAGRYGESVTFWREAHEAGEAGAGLELARVARLAGDSAMAESVASSLAERGDEEERWAAVALLARMNLDRGAARPALERVERCAPQVSASFELEEVRGLALLALGDAAGAEASFQRCLGLAQEEGLDRQARVHALLGMVSHQRESWADAANHSTQAEVLNRRVGRSHAAATAAVNVAVARLEAGELGAALEPLQRAVETLAGVGRAGELAGALYNLGSLFLALGDVDSGLRVHGRAVEAAMRASASHVEAYCDLLLSDLLRRRRAEQDLERAVRVARRAEQRFQALDARREVALSVVSRAEVLVEAEQLDEAVELITTLSSSLDESSAGLELSMRVALCQGRLVLAGSLEPTLVSNRLTSLARRLSADGAHPDFRLRLASVRGRLLEHVDDLASAGEEATIAAGLLERAREHIPERFLASWEAEPDRRGAIELVARLGEGGGAVRSGRDGESALTAPQGAAVLRRLLSINKRLNSELRLGRLLDEIIDTIVGLTDAERGFLLLRGRDGALRARSARNIDRRSLTSEESRLSRSIAEQVVATGEPVLTVDARADDRFDTASSVHALRLRSILAVPLRVKSDIVGAVYVDDRLRPGAFGEGAMQLALDVADQAAIAVENARLLRENRRRQRKIEKLNQQLKREVDRQKVELEELRRELDGQRKELATRYSYDAIVARSSAMAKVFRILDRVTDSEVPVVIQGESGTGKELVARAIHFNGPRSNHPFVTENCGAIPETLLESVLFGHVKGAYTGADRSRQGLFEVASGGTLLLDEIAEMSTAMQAKLLRVLQEGELRPVGGDQTVKVDVRVITSSNQDLGEMVRAGTFREDLFYRLNVITVRLPPLRDRREDIPLLVEHFVAKHGARHVSGVDREALRRLTAYRWPGNVRQLENEMMRASVLADDVIREEHLSPEVVEGGEGRRPDDLDLRAHVAQLERKLITKALERSSGNQSKASKLLGLSRYGLQKKMTRHGLRDG